MAMSKKRSVLQIYDSNQMSVRMTLSLQLQLKLASQWNISICQLWNCQIKRLAQSETRDLNKRKASMLTQDGIKYHVRNSNFEQFQVLLACY